MAREELRVGPLPVEGFASCGDGLKPLVDLRQPGLLGRDDNGQQTWRVESLPAQNTAYADQSAPLGVTVAATL